VIELRNHCDLAAWRRSGFLPDGLCGQVGNLTYMDWMERRCGGTNVSSRVNSYSSYTLIDRDKLVDV